MIEHLAGIEVLRQVLVDVPRSPGIYQMLDEKEEILYIGKARNLQNRLRSYTQTGRHSQRILRMIARLRHVVWTLTTTEVEALLLETNLIKKHRPPYNVLMRDDKSFPYLLITEETVPKLLKHRGSKSVKGNYYGPFASPHAVNATMTALLRGFQLRNCPDHVFANRERPCLQYQIKRCTAPCVGFVTPTAYAAQVQAAKDFLQGKSHAIKAELADSMQKAAAEQNYELAANLRDKIRALTHIQAQQDIHAEGLEDCDIFVLVRSGHVVCVQLCFMRNGANYGNHAYFPQTHPDQSSAEILSGFIAQFYNNKPLPREILTAPLPDQAVLLVKALAFKAGHKIHLHAPQRGTKKQIIHLIQRNARESLRRHLHAQAAQQVYARELAELFDLPHVPQRIEVFDNSHLQGKHAVGAMIVIGEKGFDKKSYRKFRIENPEISQDDYAMMRHVLTRRLHHSHPDGSGAWPWPDLIILDGGKGQLSAALEVTAQLAYQPPRVVAIAKHLDRNAGREIFYLDDGREFLLPPDNALLAFLQRARDEAHRFVITTHRQTRQKALLRSPLDEIPGIGAKRKKALLQHFGSAKAVAAADPRDLVRVEGISAEKAQKIYQFFHPQ